MKRTILKKIKDKIMLHRYKKDDKARSKAIRLIYQLWEIYSKKGITNYDKLFNVCLYSAIVNRDIYYLAEYYYFEINTHRKNFFGRLLTMTIVEFLEDINFLIGKDLTDELKRNGMDDFIFHIKKINSRYSSIKKKYNKEFREIRNNASAHKTKNSKNLMLIYDKFPIDNLTVIGAEIGKLESLFSKIIDLLIEKSVEQIIDVR